MAESDKSSGNSSDISLTILQQFRQLHEQKLSAQLAPAKSKPATKIDEGDGIGINGIKRKEPEIETEEDVKSHIGLSEADVGITEYISEHSGFSGIIKHRFSDFLVNEVTRNKEVVELTSLEAPDCLEEEVAVENDTSILTEEQWKKVEEILGAENNNDIFEIEVTEMSKENRTAIHKVLKSMYADRVTSNTVEKDDKKFMQIKKRTKAERVCWPKGLGIFLHFTLHKENMDTSEAVHMIAKYLRLKPNAITYAGTKDKRGKTTQRMCVKRRKAKALANCKFRNMTVGNFSYEFKPLRLGQLAGNRFKLAIRDVKAEDEAIDKVMNSLKEAGFINYFGLQRFGSSVIVPTYAIGKAILLSDWQKVVELMLKPREGEKTSKDLKLARETWWATREAFPAVKKLNKFNRCVEAKVLHALKNLGNTSYFNAINTIPRNTLLLYLHSYQSLIWNRIVSRRIKEFGLKPIAGDLVLVNKVENEDQILLDEDPEKEDAVEDNEEEVEETETISEEKEKNDSPLVRTITEEEVTTVSFSEIVYPLPGHDIEYPKNVTAEWYKELLSADNLSSEMFKNNNKTFSMSGTYRHVINTVEDLQWHTVKYQNYNDDLLLCDVDKLKKESLPSQPEDSQYKAIIMEFKLKPSTYATMALREVMKCETSTSHHAALTIANHTDAEPEAKKPKVV